MSTLTIRLPDDKHSRLRQLAKHRDISINKLIEELATISLTEFDAEGITERSRGSSVAIPPVSKPHISIPAGIAANAGRNVAMPIVTC